MLAKPNSKSKADIIREYGLDKEMQRKRVLEVVKTAPIPIGAVIPSGWILKENGLYQINNGDEDGAKLVCYEPIVISGVFENLTDESEGFIVSWHNGWEWKEISRSRDYFMANNKIIELAYYGFPVTSNNSKALIRYLTDFYAFNRKNLPIKCYSEQLGWIKDGFLLGNRYFSTEGKEVSFYPTDVGEKQIVDGFHARGDIGSWLSIIERIKDFPKVMVGIYASLSSVLSSILQVDSFIFEWSGETSKGKTVCMRIAASIWGKPEIKEGGIIKKWNVTNVNIERTASLLNHLPFFLDDTKDLPRTKNVANAVYNLASGQGRGRGSTKGSQKTRFWNNITFSTGEQKITTFTKDGGTAARVLPVTGLPFDKDDSGTAELVDSLQMDIQDCYGICGEIWINYILDNKESWDNWKSIYRTYRHLHLKRANGNSVVGRLAKYLALISTAAYLFNGCFEKDYDYESTINNVWLQIIGENGEVDRPLQALKTVYSWMVSNKHKFKYDDWSDSYGIWNHEGYWQEVYIHPHLLEDLLSAKGYEPESIFESWNKRGWLITSKDRGYKKQKQVRGVKSDYIVIKKEVLEQ